MSNLIITVEREYGSGGHEVATKLAKELGIKCYDEELISEAAHTLGFSEDTVKQLDETATKSFLYSLVMGIGKANNPMTGTPETQSLNEQVYLAELKAMKHIAEKESAIFVGRSAGYILREEENLVNVFVHGEMKDRIQRIMGYNQVSETEAMQLLVKTDKARSSYYNYYTEYKWGRIKNYDLSVNTSKIGVDGAVKLIQEFVSLKK